MGPALFGLFMLLMWAAATLLQVYGIYICFVKKWYMGAVALIVPGFALVVGAFKFFGKRDILS